VTGRTVGLAAGAALVVGAAARMVATGDFVGAGVGCVRGAAGRTVDDGRATGAAERESMPVVGEGLTKGTGERAPLRTTEPTVASGVGWGIWPVSAESTFPRQQAVVINVLNSRMTTPREMADPRRAPEGAPGTEACELLGCTLSVSLLKWRSGRCRKSPLWQVGKIVTRL
jgi:hypothetical protein